MGDKNVAEIPNTPPKEISQDDLSYSRKRRASPLCPPQRNRSFDRKFQRVLTSLVPSKLKDFHRSRSAGDLGRPKHQHAKVNENDYAAEPLKFLGQTTLKILQGTNASLTGTVGQSAPGYVPDRHTKHRLDKDLVESDDCLVDLRMKHPRTFTHLIAGYLNFLEFETDDLFKIAEEVEKEENSRILKKPNTNRSAPSRYAMGSPLSRSVLTPSKFNSILTGWGTSKNYKDDLDHWYCVCNAVISYLLDGQRYCRNFIFRKSGVQSRVNELEKQLLDPTMFRPSGEWASPPTISSFENILSAYDERTIAATLSRILRRHGPLFPRRLHYLFLQLAGSGGETSKSRRSNNRRALRLLLQLVPSRHLNLIYRPLFELLLKIVAEPDCQVNEPSIAVLFAPVFFVDRDTITPADLANPGFQPIIALMFDLAKREQEVTGVSAKGTVKLFKVPRLFLHDCRKNLLAHREFEDPPLYCSLRFCANPLPPAAPFGRSASTDTLASVLEWRSRVIATPIAPPLKDPTNFDKTPHTPLIKRPLQVNNLNFRVKRTPCQPNTPKYPLIPTIRTDMPG